MHSSNGLRRSRPPQDKYAQGMANVCRWGPTRRQRPTRCPCCRCLRWMKIPLSLAEPGESVARFSISPAKASVHSLNAFNSLLNDLNASIFVLGKHGCRILRMRSSCDLSTQQLKNSRNPNVYRVSECDWDPSQAWADPECRTPRKSQLKALFAWLIFNAISVSSTALLQTSFGSNLFLKVIIGVFFSS